MAEVSLDKIYSLFETRDIPGSEKQLQKLCIRIRELIELNGEDWVKENRKNLLFEWEYVVRQGIINK